ncbi:MAG: putative toxin-antitoxin system toxin component, PIN family [archaeon]
MTRVVADTNILVSSLFWSGNPNRIIQKGINRKLKIYTSRPIIDELKRILKRDFHVSDQEIGDIIESLNAFTVPAKPRERISYIKEDPDDNIILECAVAAGADYIISGDHHLINIGKFRNIRIVTAAEFLTIIMDK